MNKLIILASGIVCIFIGCNKTLTNSTPFQSTVEYAEGIDLSEYDNFKLTEGYAVPYVIGETNVSGTWEDFVYPLVGKSFIEKMTEEMERMGDKTDDEFMTWFDTRSIKPKVYVKSARTNVSSGDIDDFLEKAYEPRDVSGVRLMSFVDLSDKVKDALARQGITPDNTLIIEEGATPSSNKGFGWVMMIVGVLMALWAIGSYVNKVENA